MLNIEMIQQRKELLGLDTYQQLLKAYKKELESLLKALTKRESRQFALHSLKGMSFSIGLDNIGRHIQHIEQAITNGAELTADGHIRRLSLKIDESLAELEAVLH